MKLRDAQIPLVLWISAAMVVHLGGGHAAAKAADVVSEWRDLLAFSRSVRSLVRPQEVEVEVLAAPEPLKEEEREPEEEPLADLDDQLMVEPLALPEPPEPEPAPEEPKLQEQPEPEQPEPEKQAAAEAELQPQQLLLPKPDGRIAIKQHQEPGQPDNPNASRIADEAHHTAEETMARIRAYDQDSPDPTPGQARPGPEKDPGNASEDEPGFAVPSEEPGETRPGEEEGDDQPLPPAPPRDAPPTAPPSRPAAQPEQPGQPGRAPVPGREGQAAGTGDRSPEALTSPDGEYSLDPSGGDGNPQRQARKRRSALRGMPAVPGPMGFNQPGPYNLNLPGLMDAIGEQRLQQERERARNARKRKHRGAFAGADFQRYRAAIENYDPSVKPGNQTSLNAARVPFASYINKMHNRIHPIFADGFLGSLDSLSRDDPLNQNLVTHLELVLDNEKGQMVRMGVTKPSGVTAFDIGALKSAESAGPFGPPPEMIVSPDGRVYLHWEFHRDPYYACTSRFARPYLIKGKNKGKQQPLRPEKPKAPPSADERYQRPKKDSDKSSRPPSKGRKKGR